MTLEPLVTPPRKGQHELQIVEVKAATEKTRALVEVTAKSNAATHAKDHPVLKLKRPPFSGNLISRGKVVEIAQPQPQPSAFWHDPHCAISGIMRDDGEIWLPILPKTQLRKDSTRWTTSTACFAELSLATFE